MSHKIKKMFFWLVIKLILFSSLSFSVYNLSIHWTNNADGAVDVLADSYGYFYMLGYIDDPSGSGYWGIYKMDRYFNHIANATFNWSENNDVPKQMIWDNTYRYIYIVGSQNNSKQWKILKLNLTLGHLANATFDWDNNANDNESAMGIVINASDNIYVAGYTTNSTIWKLLEIDSNLNRVLNSSTNFSTPGEPKAIGVDTNGKIYVVGEANYSVSGNNEYAQWRIAQFNSTLGHTLNVTFNWSDGYDSALDLIVSNITIYSVGVDNGGGTSKFRIMQLNNTLSVQTNASFNWSGNCSANSIAIAENATSFWVAGWENISGFDYQWRAVKINSTLAHMENYTYNFSNGMDSAKSLALDFDGNVYIFGVNNSGNDYDWVIQKIDGVSYGVVSRAFRFSAGYEYLLGSAVDLDNNFYLVGMRRVAPPFNNDANNYMGDYEWEILKVNSSLDYLDELTVNWSGAFDQARAITYDNSSHVLYAAGFDNAPGGSDYQWRIIKINASNMEMIFNTTFNWTGSLDMPEDVEIGPDGNIYVIGSSNSYAEWRILKMDSNGNHLANVTYDWSTSSDQDFDLHIDSSNNLYIVGGQGSAAAENWTILKLNSTLGHIKNLSIDFSPNMIDGSAGIAADSNGYFYLTGWDSYASHDWQWRILKIDENLTPMLNTTIHFGSRYEAGQGITIDSSDHIWVAGNAMSMPDAEYYLAVVEFDTNLNVLYNYSHNMSSRDDSFSDILVDSYGDAYAFGYSGVWGDFEWRIMKFNRNQPGTGYVNGSGPCGTGYSPYTSIQNAINDGVEGDTLIICKNGTTAYLENIIINRTMNLYGNESGISILVSNANAHGININSTFVNISNLSIGGATGAGFAAVYLNSTANNFGAFNMSAYDSYYGFYFLGNTITIFSGNNITNTINTAIYLANSTLNFSGDNYIYSLPSSAYEIYLENSTLSTLANKIRSSYITFELNTITNLSVQSTNLISLGIDSVSSIISNTTGLDILFSSSHSILTADNSYYGLNITNNSATYSNLSLRIYFSSLEIYSQVYLGMGSTSGSGAWTYYDPTNKTSNSIYQENISSFSYFAPFAYNPPAPQSGDSPAPHISEEEIEEEQLEEEIEEEFPILEEPEEPWEQPEEPDAEPIVEGVIQEEALEALNEAEAIINQAEEAGMLTQEAKELLSEAWVQYELGNYEEAEKLARRAVEKIEEPLIEPELIKDKEQEKLDYCLLAGAIGLLLFLIILYIYRKKIKKYIGASLK